MKLIIKIIMQGSKNTLCTILAVVCLMGTVSSALFPSDPNCFFQDFDGKCLTSGLSGLTGQITSMSSLWTDISQKKTPAITAPQSQGKPYTNEIQTLLRFDYLRDQQFSKINQKLRKQYNLTDYSVGQVQRSIIGPQIYAITYNYQLNSIIFKVSINGDNIQVLQKSEIKLKQSGAPWRTLSKEQYQNTSDFILMDTTIKKQYNLTGFNVVEVKRLPVNGYIHQIAYTNGLNTQRSTIYIFSVYITPMTRQVSVGLVAQSLSRIEYLRIDEFRQIDAKIRKQNNLFQYSINYVDMERTLKDTYKITYETNGKTIAYIFIASVDSSGLITVQEKKQLHEGPFFGGQETLRKEKYTGDSQFIKIDAKLRKQYNLTGFFVAEVRFRYTGSSNYDIAYVNQIGDIYIFYVSLFSQDDIKIHKIEEFHVKPYDKYSTDKQFLKIDANLRNQNNLVGFTISEVKYQQRQTGRFYSIVYKNANGDTYTFVVNYDWQGIIHVTSKSMKHTTYIDEPANPFKLDWPLGGTMDSVINSKSFQACLKVLVQKNPLFASPSFESINMNQTSSLTTYKAVFGTKMGKYSAVLIYNNATGEATVQSVVSQDVSGFPV